MKLFFQISLFFIKKINYFLLFKKLFIQVIKKYYAILFFVVIYFQCFCQPYLVDNQAINPYVSAYYRPAPKTPEAATLGRYGETPVSLNTGVPNISIPIYSYNTRSISVPITISYHAGGVKVNDVSSSVGLGWSLNAGGMISWSIIGRRDDYHGHIFREYPICNLPDTCTLSLDQDTITAAQYNTHNDIIVFGNPRYSLLKDLAKGKADGSPDEFSYSFNGRSGKFVFDENGLAVPMPFEQLKIHKAITGAPTYTPLYTILDENGIKYFFSTSEQIMPIVLDGSLGGCQQPNPNGEYTSFNTYLTFIVSPEGDSVIFDYEEFGIGMHKEYTYATSVSETTYRRNAPPASEDPDCNGAAKFNYSKCINGLKIIRSKRIKSIRSSTNPVTVEFLYSTQEREDLPGTNALAAIKIRLGQTMYRSFTFSQQIIPNNPSNNHLEKRMFLRSIQESGMPPHTFSYNLTPLPPRLSPATDHWGYSNGKVSAGNLAYIPKTIFWDPTAGPVYVGSADLSPDTNFVKSGILERITYPTGGHTDFTYEPNYIWSPGIMTGLSACRDTSLTLASVFSEDGTMSVYDSVRVVTKEFTIPGSFGFNGIYRLNYQTYYSGLPFVGGTYVEIVKVLASGLEELVFLFQSGSSTNPGQQLTSTLAPGTYRIRVKGTITKPTHAILYFVGLNCSQGQIRNIQVGGLRVSRVADYSGNPAVPPTVKMYHYNWISNPERSSGIYSGSFLYTNQINFLTHQCELPNATSITNCVCVYSVGYYATELKCSYRAFSSGTYVQSGHNSGTPVNYTNVTVEHGDGFSYGKDEYIYNTAFDVINALEDYQYAPSTDYSFLRSLLLEKRTYSRNSNEIFTLLNKELNSYSVYHDYQTNYQNIGEVPSYLSRRNTLQGPRNNKFFNEKIVLGVQVVERAIESRLPLVQTLFNNCYIYRGLYTPIYYRLISCWAPLVSKTHTEYLLGDTTNRRTTLINYFYDNPNHTQITRISILQDQRDTSYAWIKYPLDFSNVSSTAPSDAVKAIKLLQDGNFIAQPIERTSGLRRADGSYEVSGSLLNLYRPFTTQEGFTYPVLDSVYKMPLAQLISHSVLVPSGVVNGHFQRDARYSFESAAITRNGFGLWTQVLGRDQVPIGRLWGYNSLFPIAEVTGATASQIAYTSFENTDKGNWTYIGQRSLLEGQTGSCSYQLSTGQVTISSLPLAAYTVDLWAKGPGAISVNQGAHTLNLTPGWNPYSVSLASVSLVSLSSAQSTVLIDELRLYPTGSQMRTYTYDAEYGVTAITEPDAKSGLFEYDNLGRLAAVRTTRKQVTKNIQYQYGVTINSSPFTLDGGSTTFSQYRTVPIQFAAQQLADVNGAPFTYTWLLGNGQSITGRTFSYAYPLAGNYTVQLTISHPTHVSVVQTRAIQIMACPTMSAQISFSPDPPPSGQSINLSISASGGCSPYSYAWEGRPAGTTTWSSLGTGVAATIGPLPPQGYEVKCRVTSGITPDVSIEATRIIYPCDGCSGE